MPNGKTLMLVSFTAERLRALDDASAMHFRGRVGHILTPARKGPHVRVEFPADGARRPIRLERVPLEFLEIVQDKPVDSATGNGNLEKAAPN
jgi:hypothetical protein